MFGCDIAQEIIQKYSTKIIPVYFDVTNNSAIKGCFEKIRNEENRLDILVNNAGIKERRTNRNDRSCHVRCF